MKTIAITVAAIAVVSSGCGSGGSGEVPSQSSTKEPLTVSGGHVTGKTLRHASLDFEASFGGCTNHPGPFVTWSGIVSTEGQSALILGKNNKKGTHVTDPAITATATVVLQTTPDPLVIPKQPPLGGAGGNPFIYFQPLDAQNDPIGDPVLLGRCVQGFGKAHFDFSWLSNLDMTVDTDFCVNSGGPTIKIEGSIDTGPGLNGKIWFQNQKQEDPAHQTDEYDALVQFQITPTPSPSFFAKQPPLGGAGGNPLIYVQLLDGQNQAVGPELFLGRCNKL